MIRLDSTDALASLVRPAVLAIGVFDGVHLGHRAVLGRALESARACGAAAVAVTFDPHPAAVLRPESAPPLLTRTPHKLELFAAAGFTHALVLRFDAELAATAPQDFLESLRAPCRPLVEMVVGCGWTFGKDRAGTVGLMRAAGARDGYRVTEIASIESGGRPVSSTRIRDAIRAGDLDLAASLLDRPHELRGTVLRGKALGRTIGFPTANIPAAGLVLPPDGVYAATVRAGSLARPAAVNIGTRPTIGDQTGRTVEAHLLDFTGDLYDREIAIVLHRFLRPEQRFDSLADLTARIARDCELVRESVILTN